MKKPILAVVAALVVVTPVLAQTASGQTSGGSDVIIRTPPSTVNSGDRNVGSPGPTYPDRLRNYTNPSIYNTRPGGVQSGVGGVGGQRR